MGANPILFKTTASGTAPHCPVSIHLANCSVRTGIAMHSESISAMLLNAHAIPSNDKATNLIAPAETSSTAWLSRSARSLGALSSTSDLATRIRAVIQVFPIVSGPAR
jgi:hypothetical protein